MPLCQNIYGQKWISQLMHVDEDNYSCSRVFICLNSISITQSCYYGYLKGASTLRFLYSRRNILWRGRSHIYRWGWWWWCRGWCFIFPCFSVCLNFSQYVGFGLQTKLDKIKWPGKLFGERTWKGVKPPVTFIHSERIINHQYECPDNSVPKCFTNQSPYKPALIAVLITFNQSRWNINYCNPQKKITMDFRSHHSCNIQFLIHPCSENAV